MFKIVGKREMAERTVCEFTIEAADIARKAKPGQFVVIRANETGERIPLTMAGTDPDAGTISIIFQVVGKTADDIIIMHDYAHHPTEIKATLKALVDSWNKRILAIFQPHRYSRTQHLTEEFARSFFQADELIVTDIYPAGEKPIDGVRAETMVEMARAFGHRRATYIADKEKIPAVVAERAQPDDMVILMGAGDVWKVARKVAELLEEGHGRTDG